MYPNCRYQRSVALLFYFTGYLRYLNNPMNCGVELTLLPGPSNNSNFSKYLLSSRAKNQPMDRINRIDRIDFLQFIPLILLSCQINGWVRMLRNLYHRSEE